MLGATTMTGRSLLLAFLTYLSLDLSTPFVPGAFNFDPDECVDGVRSPHQRASASARPTRTPMVRLKLPPPSPARPLAGERNVVRDWLVDSREDTRASGDPPPRSEDH